MSKLLLVLLLIPALSIATDNDKRIAAIGRADGICDTIVFTVNYYAERPNWEQEANERFLAYYLDKTDVTSEEFLIVCAESKKYIKTVMESEDVK